MISTVVGCVVEAVAAVVTSDIVVPVGLAVVPSVVTEVTVVPVTTVGCDVTTVVSGLAVEDGATEVVVSTTDCCSSCCWASGFNCRWLCC